MAAAEVKQIIDLNVPGQSVVQLEVDDAETYQAPFPVYGAHFQPNRDNQATDSWGVTFTPGETLVTIHLVGTTTDVTGTLTMFGQ